MKNLFLAIALLSTAVAFAQPVITKNPKDAQNCVGGMVLLDVAATGSPLRFQWQRDTGSGFYNIGSLDYWNDSLYVGSAGLEAPSSDDYRCVVVDDNGDSAISKSATVTLDSCLAPVADFTFTFVQAEVCFTNTSTNATTVLWNFGNGQTDETNNNTPCQDYGTPWYFDVTLYAYNAYGSDEKTMTIDLVGLEELSTSFDVYPNPTQDVIYVQSEAKIESIQIIDLNGRVVLTETSPARNLQLNIESIPSGVYTMVISAEGELMYHKVVKH